MSDEIKALVAKLTAKQFTGRRTLGAGTISHYGTSTMWGNEPIMELRNPDGPEAAAALTAQAEEIERLRKALASIVDDCEADYPPSHGALKYTALDALKAAQEVKS